MIDINEVLKNKEINYDKQNESVNVFSLINKLNLSKNPKMYVRTNRIIKENKDNNSNFISYDVMFNVLKNCKKKEAKDFYFNELKQFDNKLKVKENKNEEKRKDKKVNNIKEEKSKKVINEEKDNNDYKKESEKTLNDINYLNGENKFIYDGKKFGILKLKAIIFILKHLMWLLF
jgi:hypothetical protein